VSKKDASCDQQLGWCGVKRPPR